MARRKLPTPEAFAEANGLTVKEAKKILNRNSFGPVVPYDELWAPKKTHSRLFGFPMTEEMKRRLAERKVSAEEELPSLTAFVRKHIPSRNKQYAKYPTYICPFCKKEMKWKLWENDVPPSLMCDQLGYLEHCPKCKWWCRFDCLVVS